MRRSTRCQVQYSCVAQGQPLCWARCPCVVIPRLPWQNLLPSLLCSYLTPGGLSLPQRLPNVVLPRAVVLESGLGLESGHSRRFSIVSDLSWTRWYLDSDLSRTWSSDSPNVQVGLVRVQQYMLFFLFQNKDSLVPQMGNVMAIGLTPSRTGIVIGPSRTGIVIGRLLNAQLRHMSVRAAWRHK